MQLSNYLDHDDPDMDHTIVEPLDDASIWLQLQPWHPPCHSPTHLFRPAAARGPVRLLAAPTGSPRNVLRKSVPVISQ